MSTTIPTLTRISIAACLSLVAVLTGCRADTPNPGATTTPSDTGIRGTTMVDAGCPMARNASPCADKPISAKVTVTHATTNAAVAEAISDTGGRFTIALAPGAYRIQASDPNGKPVPYAAPRPVTVETGRYSDITIHLDSGIR